MAKSFCQCPLTGTGRAAKVDNEAGFNVHGHEALHETVECVPVHEVGLIEVHRRAIEASARSGIVELPASGFFHSQGPFR